MMLAPIIPLMAFIFGVTDMNILTLILKSAVVLLAWIVIWPVVMLACMFSGPIRDLSHQEYPL